MCVLLNGCSSSNSLLLPRVEGERVRNMRSDCEIVMDTYVDCFLYFLNRVNLDDPERGAFQEDLAKMVQDMSAE